MKKLFIVITALLLLATPVLAGLEDRFSNIDLKKDSATGTPPEGKAWLYTEEDSDGDRKLRYKADNDGDERTLDGGDERTLDLPLSSFVGYGNITGIRGSNPRLTGQNSTSGPALLWDRDESSWIRRTFKVPGWYWKGGGLRAMMAQDYSDLRMITMSTSGPTLQWELTIHDIESSIWTSTTSAGRSSQIVSSSDGLNTFSMLAYQSSAGADTLSAGDLVTIAARRSGGSVAGLRIHMFEFYGKPRW